MQARGLDHLVLGVHDLDAAGDYYRQLGFTVGARNRHPWGTHNRIVQFPGMFLEIITVGEPALIPEHAPGRFSFGACVRDALARSEGFSMLVLESANAVADNAAFHAAGIGTFEPFFFERQAKRPDGSAARVAFTLAFAANSGAPDHGFFVCQQHEPQNFWNPAFQDHPNGAKGVTGVTLATEAPWDHAAFFEAFSGVRHPVVSDHGLLFELPRGTINVVMPHHARLGAGHVSNATVLSGFDVSVASLADLVTRLDEQEISHAQHESGVVVEAFGVAICFEQASSPA